MTTPTTATTYEARYSNGRRFRFACDSAKAAEAIARSLTIQHGHCEGADVESVRVVK